jgi:dTDP-4-amino-4,6-dideoxygalactose transaminase
MICTNDEEIAERCTIMRMHGINRDAWKRYTESSSWYYEVVAPGFKYNFTDLQASLGLPQLKKVDQMWQSRKNIAAKYTQALKDNELLTLHGVKENRDSSWHLFPIRLKLEFLKINRAQLIDEMRKLNVGAGVHFMPIHQHIYYNQTFKLDDKNYPVASSVFPKLVSLPIYPGMQDGHVDRVINVLVDLLEKYKK